jgi:hypothetical protein
MPEAATVIKSSGPRVEHLRECKQECPTGDRRAAEPRPRRILVVDSAEQLPLPPEVTLDHLTCGIPEIRVRQAGNACGEHPADMGALEEVECTVKLVGN